MKKFLILASLFAAASAAADSVTVFGLALGGKIQPPVCQPNLAAAVPCWIAAPDAGGKGDRIGMLNLPNPETRPRWAAVGAFEAQIGKSGELKRLSLHTPEQSDKFAIADAISAKFGQPVSSVAGHAGSSTNTWSSGGAVARLLCDPHDKCLVEFMTEAANDERVREEIARARAQPKRP